VPLSPVSEHQSDLGNVVLKVLLRLTARAAWPRARASAVSF